MSNNSFNNRVFGLVIVKSINSNFNADFTHQPRTLPDGTIYATDKVLKYSVRHYIKSTYPDAKILYYKNLNTDIKPSTLDETYKKFFGDFPSKRGAKTEANPTDFFLFRYDGENVSGLIPEQPKTKNLKEYFKALPEESNKKSYEKDFTKLAGKKVEKRKLEEVQKIEFDNGEPIIFYFEKDNASYTIIEGGFEELEEVASEIDNLVTGGLDRKKILANLLSCLDIRLFGATYAGAVNLSVHGPVQITHGINRYTQGNIYSEPIMSPFRNPGEKSTESSQTTLGSQSNLHEGHYVFHFSINPKNLATLQQLSEGDPLMEDDIDKLKMGLTQGVTYYDSSRKAGTENELLLWIQFKENEKKLLPSLIEMVDVVRANGKVEIDLEEVSKVVKGVDNVIESIELHYLPEGSILKNVPSRSQGYHLLTGEKIDISDEQKFKL
jgi:CRISPR-associated protein Csh2